jgi:hypothetical protein
VTATLADLMHLVDRAEKGTLLAEEAVQLRAAIRGLYAAVSAVGAPGVPVVHQGATNAADGRTAPRGDR